MSDLSREGPHGEGRLHVPAPSGNSRNPTWDRDELVLALDLYVRHRSSLPGGNHPEVIELSRFLGVLATYAGRTGRSDFRNANGVAMKLQNFRRLDPTQKGKGLPGGGKGEADVWQTFAHDAERLRTTAVAIRSVVASDRPEPEVFDEEEAEEGRVLTLLHRDRERDRRIVERCKARALRDFGALRCEACGFDFSHRYGTRGAGFIECHHTKPISQLRAGERTKLKELSLLCANCHRMVHVRRPWMTIEELKATLKLS